MHEHTNPIYCLRQVLDSVNNRIAEVETKLAELVKQSEVLTFGSFEERSNYSAQCSANGELLGLARAQGALEGRINVTEIWLAYES